MKPEKSYGVIPKLVSVGAADDVLVVLVVVDVLEELELVLELDELLLEEELDEVTTVIVTEPETDVFTKSLPATVPE